MADANTKPRTRRQLVEEARKIAMSGDWPNAVVINREFLERFPRDADAQNRLGRAFLEQKQYASALEAYSAALKIDPANMIARRNLQRLELLRKQHSADEPLDDTAGVEPVIPRTGVFIEEVGKTWVDELVNPAAMELLAEVSSGEQLFLEAEGGRLFVCRGSGERLGEIEAKTAERLAEMLDGGNRYELYALGLSSASLRVILREVYRDPKIGGKVSFPRQISQTRAYLRDRDLLRQRDEAGFFMSDDDDEELEEEETSSLATDDEETTDQDTFEEDAVVVEEEEPQI